jgi:HAD superfamily hydrolase (TIGR01493 family)
VAKAVIFDFSGTLFRCEDTVSWLRAVLDQAGIAASDREIADAAAALEASGGQPGGHSRFTVPPHLALLWERRDTTPEAHRRAYTALIAQAALPWPGLVDRLYDRNAQPEAWRPYPDTATALRLLAERAVPVAVVSNIGWDLRPVFRHHGVDHLVRGYLLSYEEGVIKPDPQIFHRACALLGHDPRDVLMVGDDPVADGGASAIGCAFRAVPHLPPDQRPRALLDAVEDVGR